MTIKPAGYRRVCQLARHVTIDGIGQVQTVVEGRDGCINLEAKPEGIVATYEREVGNKLERRRIVLRPSHRASFATRFRLQRLGGRALPGRHRPLQRAANSSRRSAQGTPFHAS